MTWLFWIAAAVVAFAYAGYPCWLWLRSRWRRQPIRRESVAPPVSVVMVVRNEEARLREKLQNLLSLDYPAEQFQLVVVSDGSTDGTETILREAAQDPRIQIVLNLLSRGKACGLNDGVGAAQGDVVVFTDARQHIEAGALRLLMENFADPKVGAASGELMLGHPENGEVNRGMGIYWRVEKSVRELESGTGSVIGATGAFYAVRRQLVAQVPAETILDDVFIPMEVVRQGYRVVFDSRARAWDSPNLGSEREFRRKVRTLMGNYQLLQLCPWLLGSENPVRFSFISHKLLRLVVPFALLALIVTSALAQGMVYRVAFWLQAAGYGLSALGWSGWRLGPLSRLADAAFTLVVLNTAAAMAFVKFVTGQKAEWVRPAIEKEIEA